MSAQIETTVFFSGNRGLDRRHGGGIRYDILMDPATARENVLGLSIGAKPRDGRVPRWGRPLFAAVGNQPDFARDRIVRTSVIKETVAGKERFALGTFDPANRRDLLVFKTGLDVESGSTGNHLSRLLSVGTKLMPHGVVPFDEDTLQICGVDSAELHEILNDPTLRIGKSDGMERIGGVQNKGKVIPGIRCAEVSTSAWVIGAKGVALKGLITGEVFMIRRIRGDIVEKLLPESQRALFERLLFADRDAQAKSMKAAAEAAHALRRPVDEDDAARS